MLKKKKKKKKKKLKQPLAEGRAAEKSQPRTEEIAEDRENN